MPEFVYQDMFPLGTDPTEYRLLTSDYVTRAKFEDQPVLKIAADGLTRLTDQAFTDVSHLLRTAHLRQLANILNDPETSRNDRYVALEFIKNAVISAEGEYPMCQDTGTAIVMGKKGQRVWTGFADASAISKGVFQAYQRNNLRYSQNAPIDMYTEKNTGTNLPAQIDIYATEGDAYKFLFIAKGGGSANKTYLFQETRAILRPDTLPEYLKTKMKSLGTAACPPYHLAFVIGGTSAELNLKTVKLASAGYLDSLPTSGNEHGRAFRDLELEARMLGISRDIGLGAQFGGKAFCHDVRIIRLPRHGASCPIGMGVSCSADRNIKGKITPDGIFLEKLETNPARFLPEPSTDESDAVHIDLNRPMTDSDENPELSLAFDYVQHTCRNVFLTGKAGTGKTTFLHTLKNRSPKRMIVVAPTGVAAVNAGGVTIHSFFQLPFGPLVPDLPDEDGRMGITGPGSHYRFGRQKIDIIRSLDLLVIDEISMVRADLLDGIDTVLRRFRPGDRPFGGVQLLMIGDMQQLAPVVKDDDWQILRDHYETLFFFSSLALRKTGMVSIELKHIYRQRDAAFINLLGKVRDNRMDDPALAALNKR